MIKNLEQQCEHQVLIDIMMIGPYSNYRISGKCDSCNSTLSLTDEYRWSRGAYRKVRFIIDNKDKIGPKLKSNLSNQEPKYLPNEEEELKDLSNEELKEKSSLLSSLLDEELKYLPNEEELKDLPNKEEELKDLLNEKEDNKKIKKILSKIYRDHRE